MKAVILATGFGGKLSPLTDKTPASLLEVGGRPVIDYMLDLLVELPQLEEIQIRTNDLYYPVFREWLRRCDYMGKVELSSNGIDCKDRERGILCEIDDICKRKRVGSEIVVASGDNIFDFSMEDFVEFGSSVPGDVIAVSTSKCHATTGKSCVVTTSNNRVIDFKSSKGGKETTRFYPVALFMLSSNSVAFIKKYLVTKGEKGKMYDFFSWSYRRRPLFAYQIRGKCYHIHDSNSYSEVCSEFEKNGR